MAINFTGSYSQDFDTLASSGSNPWANNVTLSGWYLFRQPAPGTAITTYTANTGSSNAGSFYSYGSDGNGDRALGGLGSGGTYFGSPATGNVAGWFAFAATNTSGSIIDSVTLSFNGEQWRNGGNTTAQTMVLEYGFGTSFETVTTWTAPGNTFDWASPVATATAGAVDGNSTGLVTNVGGSLAGLGWNTSETLWIRWVERNDAGNDHGLAIDNFSLTTEVVPPPTTPIVTIAATDANAAEQGQDPGTFRISRTGDTTSELTVTYTIEGTATNGTDYTPTLTGTATIAAGAAFVDITITPVDDATVEAPETVVLTLVDAAEYDLGSTPSATVTIADNDFTITPIYDIQGAGHTSPLVGQSVTTTGIVTAVDTNGFYLQDATGDGNIATSDAIFVFTNSRPTVAVGNALQVRGTVSEFTPGGIGTGNLSTTQISGSLTITTLSTGNALPAAVVLGVDRTPPNQNIDDDQQTSYNVQLGQGVYDPINDGLDFFESLEGMRVTINDARAVSGTNGFGEIFTVANNGDGVTGLSDRGTLNIAPDDFNPERIQVQYDSGILPGFSLPEVNVGAQLGDVTGVVGYNFGNFEVNLTQAFTPVAPSTLAPEVTQLEGSANDLTVASYNVLNLDPNDNDGDTDIADGRFTAIAQQIVNNLKTPDIIGLQEVQDNNGSVNSDVTAADQTLQRLIDEIAAISGINYAFIDNPFIGNNTSGGQPGGNIRTAFLYNPDRVSLVQGSVQTIGSQAPGEAFFETRLPLVATFEFNGQEITVVNNHFSSKGGSSPLFGRNQPSVSDQPGQGQENPAINGSLDQRLAQAQAVKDYVDSVLSSNPNANIAVLGDLNEFEFISPLELLEQSLTNLTESLPENERYTFIFDGNSQSLDHILASSSLTRNVAFDIVHVNTEFAVTNQRASDHDPLVARFNLAPSVNLRFGQRNSSLILEAFEDDVLIGEERGRQNGEVPNIDPFVLFAVDSPDSGRNARFTNFVDQTWLDQGEGIGIADGDDRGNSDRKRIDGDEILGISVVGFEAKDALINVDRITSTDGAQIRVQAFDGATLVDSEVFVLGSVPTRSIQTLVFGSENFFDTLQISAADSDTRFTFRSVELPQAFAV